MMQRPVLYKSVPIIVWVLLLILPTLTAPPGLPEQARDGFIFNGLLSNTLLLILFYLHTFVLLPLIKKEGWVLYVVTLLALLGAYYLIWFLFRTPPHHPPFDARFNGNAGNFQRRGPMPLFHLMPPFIAMLCSYCYRIIVDNAARQQLIKERETVHLRTELNFLRAQINPHFLFNILNSLTSLARKRSEKLEPAIVNLSQLMRYMLYETDESLVLLEKEIDYLKSFIDLQLLRYDQGVTVKFDIEGNTADCRIGSMLLITLVENAFKHGAIYTDVPIIFINLTVNRVSDQLFFTVGNRIPADREPTNRRAGIGLKNLKRRLAILYPNRHQLMFDHRADSCTATLTLALT